MIMYFNRIPLAAVSRRYCIGKGGRNKQNNYYNNLREGGGANQVE